MVDDGSTDGTMDVVEHLAKSDNRIRRVKVNHGGRSVARNHGNLLANADIICVQDADDESLEKRAAITLDYFKNHPEIGMFYGGFFITDFLGKIIDQRTPIPFNYDRILKESEQDFETIEKDCQIGKPPDGDGIKLIETGIGHGTMAYRKDVVSKFRYDEKGKFSKFGLDDWKLQVDVFNGGIKFGYTLQPLYFYRQLNNTVTATRNIFETLKTKKEFLKSYARTTV